MASQPLIRRPSAGFTPVLGAVHERSDSATSTGSRPESPHGYGNHANRFSWSTASRRASLLPSTIKRKATRNQSRRQQTWLIVLCTIAVWTLLGGHHHARETTAAIQARLKKHSCAVMPWLQRCAKNGDPFAGLKYDVRHGLLHYPAVLDDPEASRDPLNPPSQPHPIHYLMRDAEQTWEAKMSAQSKTLQQAVGEYRRRYRQPPPKGFDKWWEFTQKHNVQLPDEYDSIYRRILPFASLPSAVLRDRSDRMQNDDKMWIRDLGFTIKIREGGKIDVDGPMRNANNRADQTLDLLRNIAHLVPVDVNLTITGHDTPWITVTGEAREAHIEAALSGDYIAQQDIDDPHDNWDYDGWSVICPPDSPLRKLGRFDTRKDSWKPAHRKNLIQDHEEAMDVCNHPENQPIHGFTAWPGPRPGLLYPLFSFTSSSLHSDLLIPPLEQFDHGVGPDPPWGRKRIDKVIWRGSTTGSDLAIPHMRKWSQRPRLCRLRRQTGLVTVQTTPLETAAKKKLVPAQTFTEHASHFAEEYFDFMFQGHPQQCGDAKSCADFEAQFEWDSYMSPARQNEYKYVIDVDGNGWSGRFHRLMASNSLVLKSTVFPEWYADRIQPWVHYVPVNVDYGDLWDIMAFFKGDLEGQGGHDHLAEQIATQGKEWTKQFWRWEDMQAYFLRLILEYARVMHKDPKNPTNMDYKS